MNGGFGAAGDIATGMLIARTVEPQAGETATGDHHHGLCLNCSTALAGDFCHRCGQTGHVHHTVMSIVHDLLHGVFHFEGKVWRTLPMLFTRPGTLTRRYIAGERARFVSPLALFLFSVFLMVATFETIGGPLGEDSVKVNRDGSKLTPQQSTAELVAKRQAATKLQSAREAMNTRGGDTDKIDDQIEKLQDDIQELQFAQSITQGKIEPSKFSGNVHTGIASLDERVKYALKEPGLFLYKLQSTAYKFSWALIPISLPLIWLLFAFRRDVGPYDHAIFAIYSLSAMTLGAVGLSIGTAIGLPAGMIATIFTFGPPLHMYKQLRGAYRLGRFGAIWRTFALLLFAFVAGLIFFIVILGLIA